MINGSLKYVLVAPCVLFWMVCLHCCFTLFPDPVWKGPFSGGRWKADSEADHRPGARHPVFVPAHKQGQQRRGSAAPRYRHYCPGPPKNEAHSIRKNQCRWHGDSAAPHRADHGQSQVAMMTHCKHFKNHSTSYLEKVAFKRKCFWRQFDQTCAAHFLLHYKGFFFVCLFFLSEAGVNGAV